LPSKTVRRLGSGLLLTSVCGLLLAGAAQALAPAGGQPSVTGTAHQGQTLTLTQGNWQNTPTPPVTDQWQDCDTSGASCNAISGATGSTYILTANDVGHTIVVLETASNTDGTTTAGSAPTATVTALAPPSGGQPTISGTPQVGQILTEAHGTWTNTPTSYAYQWERCSTACTAIAGANNQTYTVVAADEGFSIEVQETATNADGSSVPPGTSAATAEVLPPPVDSTVPTITGITWQGQMLTEAHGTWTNTPTSYTYQWMRCTGSSCALISGATAQTYVLTSTDVGDTIEVQETASNADGASATPATSTATATITLPPPTDFSAPTISGVTQQGQTLNENHGRWTNSPTSYTYQWIRCDGTGVNCVAVAGQTAQAYALTAADVGGTIVVVETATNAGGSNYAYSALTSVVTTPAGIVPPPVNASPPTASGVAQQGGTLTASTGSWSNNPSSYAYQWMRCKGSSCAAIPGATGQSYTLSAADVGFAIAVQETATNAGGDGAAVISGRTSVITTTSTTALVSPSAPVTNQNVTLVATITTSSGNASPSGSVTFNNGGGAIGGCASEPVTSNGQSVSVTCQTTFAASTDTLSAVYTSGSGSIVQGSSSPTSTVTVGRAPTFTSLTVSKQVTVGTDTTFTANVRPPASSIGPIAPSGSVEFLDAGKPIPACRRRPLGSQAATCEYKYKTMGTHRISARYSSDANFTGSSSSVHRLKAVAKPHRVLGIITSTLFWKFYYTPAYTKFLQFVAYGVNPGASIFATCHGSGCPFAQQMTPVASGPKCGTKGKPQCPSRTLDLEHRFHKRHLRVGSVITVAVVRPGWIGKCYSFKVRARQAPSVRIAPLPVGDTRPRSC
jgi:hypothetical protein